MAFSGEEHQYTVCAPMVQEVFSVPIPTVSGTLHSHLILDRTLLWELHTHNQCKLIFVLTSKTQQEGSSNINVQATANFPLCKSTTQLSHQSLNSLLMTLSLPTTLF